MLLYLVAVCLQDRDDVVVERRRFFLRLEVERLPDVDRDGDVDDLGVESSGVESSSLAIGSGLGSLLVRLGPLSSSGGTTLLP